MKRTPLARRTPLRAKVGLSSRTELQRRAPLLSRTPINPVSDKRKCDNYERRKVVSGMRLATSGECARCGRRDLPVHGHEKLTRAHGGDIINPSCLLCDPCNSALEDAPRVSAWNGWRLSAKWPHDPALQPFEARRLDGVIVDLRAVYAVEYEDVSA